jgi:hypothetical protein
LRARHLEIAKAEGGRQLLVLLVGQPVGQRAVLQRAVLQHLADEGLVVDVALKPEGRQRHAQQAAVRHQLPRPWSIVPIFSRK